MSRSIDSFAAKISKGGGRSWQPNPSKKQKKRGKAETPTFAEVLRKHMKG